MRFFKSRKNEKPPNLDVLAHETEARRQERALVRSDDVAGVYEIRVSPGYLQFAPDTDRTGRPLYGKRIEWRHLLFP